MPGTNGIDATRHIVTQRPEIAVLVLTMYDDDETVFAALRAGARGYLLKGAEQDEVVSAVIGVARGEAIFGPATTVDVRFRVGDVSAERRRRGVLRRLSRPPGGPAGARHPSEC